MSGSVVFTLLALFIALMILIAASCIFFVVRKGWLSARREKAAVNEPPGALTNTDHSSEVGTAGR